MASAGGLAVWPPLLLVWVMLLKTGTTGTAATGDAVAAEEPWENRLEIRTSAFSLRATLNETNGHQILQTSARPWNYSSHAAPVKATGLYAIKKPRGAEGPDHATFPRHRKSSLRKMSRRFRLHFKPYSQSQHSPSRNHLRVSSRMNGKFVGDCSNSSTAKFNISEALNQTTVICKKSFNHLSKNMRPLENYGLNRQVNMTSEKLKSNDNEKYPNHLMISDFLDNNRIDLNKFNFKSLNITRQNGDQSIISSETIFDLVRAGETSQQVGAGQRVNEVQESSNSKQKSRRSLESSGRNVSPSGLEWRVEPPLETRFSNSSGGAIDCGGRDEGGSAASSTVSWNYEDGRPVREIPGLVRPLSNGSLLFPPFPGPLFDAAVHSATYTCTLRGGGGALLSRPARLRAVVDEPYEVQTFDEMVTSGNTALLRCRMPPSLADVVTVTSWLRDNAINIFPSVDGDGKHHVTEAGDLLVLSVSPSDGLSRYQCRALNTVTGATRLSRSAARIIVAESQTPSVPRLHPPAPHILVDLGRPLTLLCLGEGSPPPHFSWAKDGAPLLLNPSSHPSWGGSGGSVGGGGGSVGGGGGSVGGGGGFPGSRYRLVGGSLLLPAVVAADAGHYTCFANNTAGSASVTTRVAVATPLTVQVTPPRSEVGTESRLALRCLVSGGPVDSVAWYKDASRIRSSDRVRVVSSDRHLVVSPVQSSDAGVYQCRASSLHSVAHAHAVVTLGAAAPRLVYRFIAHTLQPGPPVTLKCIAQGAPTPTIGWTLDGFPLPHSHRILIGQFVSSHGDVISHVNISSVRVDDGGLYQCVASNSAGTVEHSARLNVYGPPTVRPMGQLIAVAGETFSVMCPVAGHPIEDITWAKEGEVLPVSHRQQVHSNGTLTLRAVARDTDEGRYSCTATGRQGGSDSQHLTLRVIVPPRLGPLQFPAGTRAGMRAQVGCYAQEGDLPMQMSWRKDGRPLEPSFSVRISKTDDFASLLVITEVAAEHAGNYTCLASNAARTASTSAFLAVSVPPSWLREPSDASATLGGAARIPCTAAGFPNPTIEWLRETASSEWTAVIPVSTGGSWEGGGEYQVGGSSGLLDGVVNADEGEHQLSASFSSEYERTVVARASSLMESGAAVVRARDHIANGARHTDAAMSGDHVIDMSSPSSGRGSGNLLQQQRGRVRASSNGTLQVLGAEKQHEGRYLCQATNGVGAGLSKIITLYVKEPPWFPERSRLVEVEAGASATLTCRAHGDPPLTLRWTRDSGALPATTRYRVRQLPPDGGAEALELTIDLVQAADTGAFMCEAANEHGTRSTDFRLLVQDVPGPVTSVTVTDDGSRHVMLTWQAPRPPSTSVTTYVVSYTAEHHDAGLPREVRVPGHQHQARLEGLRPATWYTFAVAAENGVGQSSFSTPLTHATQEEKPEGKPQNVQVTSPSPSSLRVRWEPPPSQLTHGRLLGYYLGLADHSSLSGVVTAEAQSSLYNFTTVGGGGAETQTAVTGLRPYTRYSIILQTFNSKGAGPPSDPVLGVTQQDKPDAPPSAISCSALSSSRLQLRWHPPPPTGANGVIVRYRLTYTALDSYTDSAGMLSSSPVRHLQLQSSVAAPGASVTSSDGGIGRHVIQTTALDPPNGKAPGSSSPLSPSTSGGVRGTDASLLGAVVVEQVTEAQVAGLLAWRNYSFRVAAATDAGLGVTSEPVRCATLEDVPGGPRRVKAVVSGPHTAIVAWTPPSSPRGRLLHYTVHWNTSSSRGGSGGQGSYTKTVDASQLHAKLHQLPRHQLVAVWVTASTSVGEGDPSPVAAVTPSDTVGAAVWSVGGAVTASVQSDVLLQCRTVGQPPPSRTWTKEGGALTLDGDRVSVLDDGSLRLTSVQRDTRGRYSCTATNDHGTDTVNYSLTVLVPPSSPSLHVTEATSSSVRLQWDVSDDGGAPLLASTLYYRSSSGETVERTVQDNSHTEYGLRCGTQYHFFIVAHNHIGSSPSSPVVEARTKGRTPTPPPQFQFVTSNGSQATLYLSQWQSGGCPIDSYSVHYRQRAHKRWTTVSNEIPPSRTFAVSGLEPSTAYELRVTATNAAGTREQLYSFSTARDPSTALDSPWPHREGEGLRASGGASMWRDLRVTLPASLSLLLLLCAAVMLAFCLRKRRHGDHDKSITYSGVAAPDQELKSGKGLHPHPAADTFCVQFAADPMQQYEADTTLQQRQQYAALQPQLLMPSNMSSTVGEEDVYQYASALYQLSPQAGISTSPRHMERTSPAQTRVCLGREKGPRAGPSRQKSFSALVYQAPSLQDVDAPNTDNPATENAAPDRSSRGGVPASSTGRKRHQDRPPRGGGGDWTTAAPPHLTRPASNLPEASHSQHRRPSQEDGLEEARYQAFEAVPEDWHKRPQIVIKNGSHGRCDAPGWST